MAGRDDDLPFRVELWDDKDSHIEEVIALASDYTTAHSAYEEAVKRRPGKLITLRQKTRVIQKSDDVECEGCHQPLIEIDHYGEHLIGCIECNCWRGGKSAFIVDLSIEDIQALRDGRQARYIRRRDVGGN